MRPKAMAMANFPVMLRMMASTLMSCGGEGRLWGAKTTPTFLPHPPLPCFIVLSVTCSVVINMSGAQNLWICVTRVRCGEVSVPLTFSLCAFLLCCCLLFQSHCWLQTGTIVTVKIINHSRRPLFWEPLWLFDQASAQSAVLISAPRDFFRPGQLYLGT